MLTFANPEQFAPQQFQLCSQLIYRYSHHCYTLPYPSGTNLRHSPSMSCLALLCISLTFDAFAFPFLTIQSLCLSFSTSRFCCTAELNNSCTIPCISLSNLRYTIPLLKSTLLFRCYYFRFLAAPLLVLSVSALHSISNAEPTDATASIRYTLPLRIISPLSFPLHRKNKIIESGCLFF
jgi:hypothetical protein